MLPITSPRNSDLKLSIVKGAPDINHIGNAFQRAWRAIADWFFSSDQDKAYRQLYTFMHADTIKSRCDAFDELTNLVSGPHRDLFIRKYNAQEKNFTFEITIEGETITTTIPLNQLKSINLSGMDLTGIDLSDLDLSGVNFSNAILNGANFSRCTLNNTNFTSAQLNEANFSNANASNANFSLACMQDANLSKFQALQTRFESAHMERVSLLSANLTRCDFGTANNTASGTGEKGANLEGAKMSDATINECFFMNAILDKITAGNLKANNSNFTAASLASADITHSRLTDCDFTAIDANQIKLTSCTIALCAFNNSKIIQGDLSGSTIEKTKFEYCKMLGIDFKHVRAKELIMCFSNITGGVFFDGFFDEVDFSYAKLDHVSAEHSRLTKCNVQESSLKGAVMYGARLREMKFSGSQVQAAKDLFATDRANVFFGEKISNLEKKYSSQGPYYFSQDEYREKLNEAINAKAKHNEQSLKS